MSGRCFIICGDEESHFYGCFSPQSAVASRFLLIRLSYKCSFPNKLEVQGQLEDLPGASSFCTIITKMLLCCCLGLGLPWKPLLFCSGRKWMREDWGLYNTPSLWKTTPLLLLLRWLAQQRDNYQFLYLEWNFISNLLRKLDEGKPPILKTGKLKETRNI